MLGYVEKALTQFQHETPKWRQDAPYTWNLPKYGEKIQYDRKKYDSSLMSEKEKKYIQKVTGKFLSYSRDVDPNMITALSAIASQKSAPMEDTMKRFNYFLD